MTTDENTENPLTISREINPKLLFLVTASKLALGIVGCAWIHCWIQWGKQPNGNGRKWVGILRTSEFA